MFDEGEEEEVVANGWLIPFGCRRAAEVVERNISSKYKRCLLPSVIHGGSGFQHRLRRHIYDQCHRQGGQEIRQRSGTQTLFSLTVASHILPTSVAPLCPLKKLRYGPDAGLQRRAVPPPEGPELCLGSGLVAFARRTFCQHHRWRRRRQRKRCLAARWQRQQRIGGRVRLRDVWQGMSSTMHPLAIH